MKESVFKEILQRAYPAYRDEAINKIIVELKDSGLQFESEKKSRRCRLSGRG